MQSSHGTDAGEQGAARAGTAEQRPPGEGKETLPAVEPAGEDGGLSAELAQIEDRYKRALADLDNYRKRSTRELERRVQDAKDSVLRDWFDVVDSVERAIQMEADAACREGLAAVLAQIDTVLSRHGLQRIGAPGTTASARTGKRDRTSRAPAGSTASAAGATDSRTSGSTSAAATSATSSRGCSDGERAREPAPAAGAGASKGSRCAGATRRPFWS